MRSVLLFGLALVSLTLHAQSEPVKSLDFTIHQEYISTRASGMGNAFTAGADDFSAIFYNPAMLALRNEGHLRMFARAGLGPESLKLFKEIEDVKKVPDADQPQAYTDLITSHYGDHFNYRLPTAGAVWARPGWGIALIPVDLSLDLSIHRQIGPMVNVNMYQDSTLAVAYARKMNWWGKRHETSWGATIKSIHRIHVGEAISAGQLANGSTVWDKSHANEGLTFDLDLGYWWRPPVPQSGMFKFLKHMEPSFAFVVRNAVDYGFKQNFHLMDKNSGEPPKLQRRFDFGSKWDLPKVWVFDPHFALDVRDVGHPNWTPKKGIHAGAELYWKMYNWWKGHWAVGLNQGYWTAGFGARMAIFQLDIATYGEEVGTPSVPIESRRYMLEAALDF
ncbi:MAG: hypothetical protein KF799_08640 [Bdellovibrionales bacterium]|nr:hypothetical protein [Bdellovibrionales bacterium]